MLMTIESWIMLVMQLLPTVMNAASTIAADKGKPITQVIPDVISHLTPGQPNAPALGPTAPTPAAPVAPAAS